MQHAITATEDQAEPNGAYLDRLMRRGSFEALWPLFSKATKPAKEMTESFSALAHLRPFMNQCDACRVIHVGDGAHGRTAALFALKSSAENISVDPLVNHKIIDDWKHRYEIRRLTPMKARLSEVAQELNALSPLPVFVTFVHAHVSIDEELASLRWDAAFSLACCVPGRQLSKKMTPVVEGIDLSVLSPARRFQVLIHPDSFLAQRQEHIS
jgi:hypothetical protein